jgi:hypothetical protein
VIARLAIAVASRSLDFPDPFSPTKIVTGRSSSSRGSELTAGTSNGKARG